MLFSVCFPPECLTFVLYISGEQLEIFWGRCGSLEQGHFDKYLICNMQKKYHALQVSEPRLVDILKAAI